MSKSNSVTLANAITALATAVQTGRAQSKEAKANARFIVSHADFGEAFADAANVLWPEAGMTKENRRAIIGLVARACEQRAAEAPESMLSYPADVIRLPAAGAPLAAVLTRETVAETRARVKDRQRESNAKSEAKYAQMIADANARQLAELAALPAEELAAALQAAAAAAA